jgi:hypothetical protein
MKALFIILGVVFVFGWNAVLARRDAKMFDAYNQACSTLPQPHPDCRYAK